MAGILQLTSSHTMDTISMAMETYQMGLHENASAAPPAASNIIGAVKNAMTTPTGVH